MRTVPVKDWIGEHPWWTAVLTTPDAALSHSKDNVKYMQPTWMSSWCYKPEDLPPFESIRYPCVERAQSELPLMDAPSDVFSTHVWKTSIAPNPDIFRIVTSVNIDTLRDCLQSFPNQSYAASWFKALKEGLWPWADNFEGDVEAGKVYPNSQTLDTKRKFIMGVMQKELSHDHWRGPLKVKPQYFRNAKLSATPKAEGGDRLIQNQSYPPGLSVNDHIPVAAGKVVYDNMHDLANVIRIFHHNGRKNLVPWKLDVSRAFRHVPLHPLFALRNGIAIKSRSGKQQLYIDSQACFGGRAFPRAYCALDDLWCWIAVKKFEVKVLFHFVDDHYGISEITTPGDEPEDMKALRDAFKLLNVPTNEKHGFGDGLVITGTEISYNDATFQLSQAKLVRYMSTCRNLIKRTRMTVDELRHVSGVLQHCILIVPYGKIWLQAMNAASSRAYGKSGGTYICITRDMVDSLKWWSNILASAPTRHLLRDVWWEAFEADELIWVDASTSSGLGIYRPSCTSVYMHCYREETKMFEELQQRTGAIVHINTVELLAVVSTVQIVAQECTALGASKKLLIMSDSQVTCDVLSKMTTRDSIMASLLRDLSEAMGMRIDLRVCHTGTEYNPADFPSRGMGAIAEMSQHFKIDHVFAFTPMSIDHYIAEAKLCTR